MMHRIKHIRIIILLLSILSCKKLIEIPPPDTEIVRTKIFEDDGTALAALSGVYNKLVNSTSFGGSYGSLNMTAGVYADELVAYQGSSSLLPFYNNVVAATDPSISSAWTTCYNIIYSANAIVEGLSASSRASQNVKKQLTGEALFIRAFVHFYLANQFGDIPYINSTNYLVNAKMFRTPASDVYQSVIGDLLQAKELLPDSYPTGERVRVNKGSVIALLARVYLYQEEWANAEAQATEIINNTSQYRLLTNPDSVFLKNSGEAIWQLIPPYGATNEGQAFILLAQPTRIALKSELALNTFEPNDLRKIKWMDSVTQGFSTWYFPFKYKVKSTIGQPTEYSTLLRLAEQYLIRAEARAQQNKLTGANSATSDINAIRQRAELGTTTATTQTELLAAIEQERRVELFTEWGHRFFDLKRWNRLDAELGPIKPSWNITDALLPIPQSEILANGNLTQNEGY